MDCVSSLVETVAAAVVVDDDVVDVAVLLLEMDAFLSSRLDWGCC